MFDMLSGLRIVSCTRYEDSLSPSVLLRDFCCTPEDSDRIGDDGTGGNGAKIFLVGERPRLSAAERNRLLFAIRA